MIYVYFNLLCFKLVNGVDWPKKNGLVKYTLAYFLDVS